jgi:hypothetical protein
MSTLHAEATRHKLFCPSKLRAWIVWGEIRLQTLTIRSWRCHRPRLHTCRTFHGSSLSFHRSEVVKMMNAWEDPAESCPKTTNVHFLRMATLIGPPTTPAVPNSAATACAFSFRAIVVIQWGRQVALGEWNLRTTDWEGTDISLGIGSSAYGYRYEINVVWGKDMKVILST